MVMMIFSLLLLFQSEAFSASCSVKDNELVELKKSVMCRCGDFRVCDQLFSFNSGEGLPASSHIGGSLGSQINAQLFSRTLVLSKRDLGARSGLGSSKYMSVVLSECKDLEMNDVFKQFLAKEISDQKLQLSEDDGICDDAKKFVKKFQSSEFAGQCTSEGVLAFPKDDIEYLVSRKPGSIVTTKIKSRGAETAETGTKRPFTVLVKENTVEVSYSLPFVDEDHNRISPPPEEKSSVTDQVKTHIEEFIQMHECCKNQNQTAEEKSICSRYQLKYLPQRGRTNTNGGSTQ